MGELKFKQNWNGLLTAALVSLLVLVVAMGYQISRMIGGVGTELASAQGMVFLAFFVGAIASLIGLKRNPKFFSFIGILNCFGVVVYILLASGLFSIESLVASIALIFLVLGNRKLGAE